jgi:superfamily I DNA/RNA helicase
MLIFGSGGCGKTRLITKVFTPLFKRYFGPRGVVTTSFSNKAARLVNGKTSHALAKLRGTKSLAMPYLRLRSDQEARALAAVWVPAGALVKDEFSQQSASLEHALAVRAMYGRCNAYGLLRDRQRGLA